MADIKWAAEQMKQGKRVRRREWSGANPKLALAAVPAESIFEITLYGQGRDCIANADRPDLEMYFSTEALLADDWEIAE